jgi:hypothetical protein
MPRDATLTSVLTDGVGLRLCLEFVPKRVIESTTKDLPLFSDVVRVGVDTGRAKLSTSVNSENDEAMIATRRSFYYHQHHHRLTKWEKTQKENTPWGQALNQLSQAAGLKNTRLDAWVRYGSGTCRCRTRTWRCVLNSKSTTWNVIGSRCSGSG